MTETTLAAAWPPSQELLDEALLEISDMPTGWAAVPVDEPDDAPCDVSISTIVGVDELPSGRAQYAEDENFGPLVLLSTGVLPPDLGNLDVLETLKQEVLACQTSADGFDISFTELSYPTIGDQSFAIRQTATSEEVTVYFDVVQARVGNVVIQVAGADFFGNATDILDALAEPQMERAAATLG